ncbi:MAG: hypothetical protein ACRC2T_10845, partial [Thermoguttaceae bacterium]
MILLKDRVLVFATSTKFGAIFQEVLLPKQEKQQENMSVKLEPGKVHEFDERIVWGPFKAGNDFVVLVTADNVFHLLENNNQQGVVRKSVALTHYPIIGRPFFHEGKILVNSLDGTIFDLDLTSLEISRVVSTEMIPQTGPVITDKYILMTSRGGCLYFYE